eukprot:g67231.t1
MRRIASSCARTATPPARHNAKASRHWHRANAYNGEGGMPGGTSASLGAVATNRSPIANPNPNPSPNFNGDTSAHLGAVTRSLCRARLHLLRSSKRSSWPGPEPASKIHDEHSILNYTVPLKDVGISDVSGVKTKAFRRVLFVI